MVGNMSKPRIHSTAVVSPRAVLADDVEVGPYAVIEDDVEIGRGCTLGPHVVVRRHVRLGRGNRLHAHAVLGGDPQHAAFDGRETWLGVGDNNVIREGVILHRAIDEGSPTRVGSGCYLMANSHVGHDADIADNLILTNAALIGGHVEVGEGTVIGGGAGIHQFVRIGPGAMVSAMVLVTKDVVPYTLVGGTPTRHYQLNRVGLTRRGVTGERYAALQAVYRHLRRGHRDLTDLTRTPEIEVLDDWLNSPTRRGIGAFAR